MTKPWSMVRLGDVLQEQKARAGSPNADDFPLLGVSNSGGLHRTTKPRIADMSRYLLVKHRWFAYNPMRINVGSVGLAETPDLAGVISPDYVVFSCTDRIEPALLYRFLRSRTGLQAIGLETAGSVRERLYFESLARITLSLPPIEEQRRIVARIEELSAHITEARTLRQQAVDEAAALVPSTLSRSFDAGSARGCPAGKLGDFVVDCSYGTSEKTTDEATGVPILRMGNIRNGQLDSTDLKYLHLSAKDRSKLSLQHGDILVNRTNSAELVGKCAVFDLEGEFAFASYLIRLRLDMERVDPRLVAALINSRRGRAFMLSEKRQMTGQANVNATKLKEMPLALPPLREQRRIVAELGALQAEVDALKRLQAESAAELNALLPSILDKAFKGEL